MATITDTTVGQAAVRRVREWLVTSTGCQAVRSTHRRPRTVEDLRVIERSSRYIGQVVLTAADGARQKIVRCEHQHRTASRATTCARQLALRLGLPRAQVCRQCQAILLGHLRSDARRRGWEPWGQRTQNERDHGPLVCRDCVTRMREQGLTAPHTVAVG